MVPFIFERRIEMPTKLAWRITDVYGDRFSPTDGYLEVKIRTYDVYKAMSVSDIENSIAESFQAKNIGIKKVIFNDPATIILWEDGTKTVVKADNEPYDPEKGMAMAIAKKALGNKGNYFNTFSKWLPKEEE
jgi:hypothetical protein